MEAQVEQIAERIRRYRTGEGLTLQELGDRAGVSASTIHKIENGQTVPTISVLLKVAHGLRRSPVDLFEGDADGVEFRHVRAKEAVSFPAREGSTIDRIVAGLPKARLDAWRLHHAPGTGIDEGQRIQYEGELIIVVEEGSLRVDVGDKWVVLEAGDTLHMHTKHPHRWENVGDTTMKALFFGTLGGKLAIGKDV